MSGTTRIASADFDEALGPEVGERYHQDFMFKVPPFRRIRDKVAIVGFTDHREMAMKLGDDFEIWGLNELYRYMPPQRFHRWFEIHGREYLSVDDEGKKHIEDLKSALGPVPVYMQKRHADIPGSVEFPIGGLIDHFGGPDAIGADYFTNCPAEMIAFAIALGFHEIHVYGVDMAMDGEYHTQRPCCEYWLGRAMGQGIKVFVPSLSDLLKCVGTYGYSDRGSAFSQKLQERIKFSHRVDNDHLAQIRNLEASYHSQHATLSASIHGYEGAIAELGNVRKTKQVSDRITALTAEAQSTRETRGAMENEYQAKSAQLHAARNQIIGGIRECEYMLRAWSMKSDNPAGGNIPSVAERAGDARTGIHAPSGDSKPALVTA